METMRADKPNYVHNKKVVVGALFRAVLFKKLILAFVLCVDDFVLEI